MPIERPLGGDRPEPLGLVAHREPHRARVRAASGVSTGAASHLLLEARVEGGDVDFCRRGGVRSGTGPS